MNLIPLILLLAVTALRGADGPADAAFTTIRRGEVVVSIPSPASQQASTSTLWLHLHGAAAVLETQFAAAGAQGVLANVTLPGLSKVYADFFADEARFERLLTEVESVVREHAGESWRVSHVVVLSFSAGFGGVRQLLRQPAALARIDALVMADSIYCGYVGGNSEKRTDPDLMAGFLHFAQMAAQGKNQFVLSHSRQVPESYASTTETADYLLAQLGLVRRAADAEAWPGGLRLLSRSGRSGFEVLGFDGAAPEDHMRHLRNIGALLRRVQSAPP